MSDNENILQTMGLGLLGNRNNVTTENNLSKQSKPLVTIRDVEEAKPLMAPLSSSRPSVISTVDPTVDPNEEANSELLDRLYAEKSALESRALGGIIKDAAVDVSGGFVNLVGNLAGLGISVAGSAVKAVSPEGSLVDRLGNEIKEFAVDYVETTNSVVQGIQTFSTETDTENTRINSEISRIESGENISEYNKSIAEGDNAFLASLTLVGKDLLDTGSRVLSDPVALQRVIAEGVGSLGPSVVGAKAGVELASIAATRLGITKGSKLAAAKIAGSAVGIGVIESASTYASTVAEVSNKTHEELLLSTRYRELLNQGYNSDDAKTMLADETGLDAFRLNFPAAILAGTISAKFNADPLNAFFGKSFVEGVTTVGREILEEGIQGATSQLSQNTAIYNKVDPNQIIAEGLGDQIALGAIGGAGIAGSTDIVSNAKRTLVDRQTAYAKRQANPDPIVTEKELAAMTPEERDANVRSTFTDADTSPGDSLFNSVVNKAADVASTVKNVVAGAVGTVTGSDKLSGAVNTIKAGVAAVKAAAEPVVNKVIKAAQDYNEKGNPVIQNETVAAAESVVADVLNPAVNTGSLGTPDESVKKKSLPEIFRDAIPESASIAETMTNIVKTIAEKKVPISSMTDDAILFVTQKFNEMQNAASTLAPEVQAKIKKVLASPDLERIRKRAARLDLSIAISPAVQIVSKAVRSLTVAMSKINPTNVNPDVVDKILKQEDRGDLTPEDIQDIQIAASVSRPMNQLINNIVKIEDDRNAFLVSSGQKPETEENSFEKVSRRLIEGDPTNQEKLPSVKKSVNQIILGMRSPDKAVDVDGVRVPVAQVVTRLKSLAQHMVNKVNALNESFDQNDEKGVGPTVNFSSLSSKTGKFIPVGQAGSGNAVYNKRSIKSVSFAKTVGADAVMLVEVHNALAKAYPDQFPDGEMIVPALKSVETATATTEVVDPVVVAEINNPTTITPDPVTIITNESGFPEGAKGKNFDMTNVGPNTHITFKEPVLGVRTIHIEGNDTTLDFEDGRRVQIKPDSEGLIVQLQGKKSPTGNRGTYQFSFLSDVAFDQNKPDQRSSHESTDYSIESLIESRLDTMIAKGILQMNTDLVNGEHVSIFNVDFLINAFDTNLAGFYLAKTEFMQKGLKGKLSKTEAEITAKLKQRIDTTAVESVPTPVGTDENAETTQEMVPETKAVEDEALRASSETIVIGLTQEKADAMTDEELIVSVNSWEPKIQSTPMEQGRADSIMAIMDPLIAPLGLPDGIIRLLAWLKSDSKTHLGQAYWAERVISLKPSAVRKILNNEEEGGIHIFFHELFHVIDAKASKKFGRTASMDAAGFDLEIGGEIYDEVKALSDSDPEMKAYFEYALSYTEPYRVSSELFAEIGAMMMLMDREIARSLLPKGVAYVEQIIEQAGGVKASANGNTAPVTDEAAQSDAVEVTSESESGAKPKVVLPNMGANKAAFLKKDQAKADKATKFIGRGGTDKSSTRAYQKAFGALANTGTYTKDDVVMISAEGRRAGRVDPDFVEIQLAMDAGATILTDTPTDRNTNYNLGEQQVADYLTNNGYVESKPGKWTPASASAPTEAVEVQPENKVSDRFVSVFRPKKNVKRKTATEILGMIAEKNGTEVYREFATILMGRIRSGMNNRLQTVLVSKADGRPLAQGLKEDQAKLLEIRDFKPLSLVDPVTSRYNQELLDLASMAVIDWMTTARSYGADRLDDMLKELGLDRDEVDDNQIKDLLNSVPTRTTSESLAKKVIKLWAVQVNKDAEMVDIRGTTEGLVKEIFTVLSQMEDPLVRIIELKTGEGRTASFELSNLKGEQEAIGLNAAGSLDKVLFPEDQIQASFGEKIAFVPKSQNNKNDVALNSMEQKASKKMQDTAHTEALPVVNFFSALGLDSWARMAGKKDSSVLGKRHPLRLIIEGKNASIERDFETAFQMVTAAAGRPIFYPVGVTNVGRHQMKGINPQNNKLLRVMATPTHSKLNMLSNQKHKNGFWLTVAQSSGLAKVEKKMHSKILSSIQADFAAKFGEATAIALSFLETGTMDSEGFADAMLKANKGEDVSEAQVNAVLAVARLQQAAKTGSLEGFETSLSFELDGKTDGPANMMVAFGQGIMTRMEYQNFKRVGFFLGSKGETLNSLFSNDEVDLYEVNSTFADRRMVEMINSATGMNKKRLMALQRFAAHFGDFVINPDGTIQMSRATSKNPMTKKVYGATEKGIAEGITQDMLVGFYTKLIALSDGVSVQDHLNYQEINQDLDLLFGVKLPDVLDVNNFILPNDKMKPFAEFVKKTIGTVLSESINEVMNEKTIGVNDLLVFSTGVQGVFMELFFEQRLAEAMSELSDEFENSSNQNRGKPTLRKMTQATYDAIVKETLAFAPFFADGLQNLRIGDFTGQQDNTEMSSNLSGNIRAKSTMARPDDMGVKAIPYVIQGRGDAMMMNRIFGSDNAPERAIPIFDGIDMAITDFTDLADQINEAVLSNWDHDVLGPIVSNFDDFLARVKEMGLDNKLRSAFSIVRADSKDKTSVTALDPTELAAAWAEAHRMNQARKAVFKRITLAVDHMGGSGQAYIRNSDGKELTFEEINDMIQDELDNTRSATPTPTATATPTRPSEPVTVPPVIGDPIIVTDVATVIDALIRETKKKHIREAVRAIKPMLSDGARIVMGTSEQVAQWRKDNLGRNVPPKVLEQRAKKINGYFDVDNNIIFIFSDNPETITHELIHMATFKAVLDHYTGVKKSVAVKNLEVLLTEFMEMDFSTATKKAQAAYNSAKATILFAQAKATPLGDAVALNEFMAWTLSNESLMKELSATPTTLVARLTKVAKVWIQRILGVIPLDMYSHILFNTEMIRNDESDWDGTPPVPPTSTAGVTPPADAFTNFWIDRLRDSLEASKTPDGKNTQDKLIRYIATADDALVKLDFGGFSLSEYQKKTFVAIHAVIAAELRLDPNALIALGKVYEHITNSLTPQMFGTGQAAQDRYSAVMELMGATKNDEGISDAIAVMLALSQTSNSFRSAMDQVPQPAAQPGIQTASLNDLLTSTTGFLMQKLIATTDTEGKGVKEILDSLSDQILRQDNQNEFRALKGLMGTFDKADAFVGGALSLLAQKTRDFNRGVQASQTNGIMKVVSGSVALATAFMDKNTSAQAGKGAKAATHMDGVLDNAVFIRELIAEIVGADSVNSETIQMLDKVTYVVQSTRQAYREELPVILQNEFTNHPDASQWKVLHWVLGKTDFASLFDLSNPDDSFDMLNDQTVLDRRIKTREAKIMKAFPGQDGKNILMKAQQLADHMNGKGAGFQLFKNAYAIHKLIVGQNNKPNFVTEIDKLVSLYALNGTDIAQREAVAAMQASDPDGVHNLLVYVQALNKEEDEKTITEAARMNGYKGYIPDHGQGEVSLIIAKDSEREDLEKRGYVRVADDTTDAASLISRGYYMTTVKQSGDYSQGVLQQVQDTYRGVNAVTGLTVNGTTSGVIAGVAVVTITDALNQSLRVADPKNVLLPVYDEDGDVLYYERAINPDLREKYLQPDSNMALMTGVWAGRQVEEKFSHEYNMALVQRLKEIWDNREPSTDGLFIRMDQAKDKIYAESWKVIPPQLKEHIFETFGEDTGFMVRRDMINLALGYRDPSITDVWTGNHRLPESVELAIKTVGKLTMGDKAFKWLANSESLTMNTISTAKDFIVVRSLVVPYMNTQSNVFQLVNRGVGTKQIIRGYKEKFAEIEKLNQNLKTIMGLQARVRLAATDKNKVAILKQQIQVLEDENERFSVSPLVKEGAYKNISEGITELDVSITDGKFGDWVESKLNKLPTGVQTVAKYGLLSKDTALYKGANKAVQYGDFVAKSIYYDDLKAKGLTHGVAMVKVNEEFINFSLLPGRTRTYMESMGATWFLTFKIRAMKTALQMMRENPVRSLAAVGVFGLESGPVTDNVLTKAFEGTLPYSLGWDMLWDAPSINPWWTVING